MFSQVRNGNQRLFIAGLAVGLLIGVGMLVGNLAATRNDQQTLFLSEIPVQATASVKSDHIAAATGPIDDKVEGLFTLDFITGHLQCAVLYTGGPSANSFGGLYGANVVSDLNIENTKKPNYLLLTGYASFVRGGGGGAMRPAACVAYVIDSNTGNFAAYGVPWNPAQVARGARQQGALIPLATGTARMVAIRE